MSQHSANRFTIAGYTCDQVGRRILLQYAFDDTEQFTEELTFPESLSLNWEAPGLEPALQALAIVGGISYYKAICPPQIELAVGTLTREQAVFWNTVYTKGLGEFFYRNNLEFTGLVQFSATQESKPMVEPVSRPLSERKVLVPFGGGKDSLVTVELLRSGSQPATLFRVGNHAVIAALTQEIGQPVVTVERTLDPKLFQWNMEGALNGHVPVTAYNSVLSVVVALMSGHDAIVMSNERSATIGNVTYRGMEVNHQWSKSLEFEELFRQYVATYIREDVAYLNPLRSFSELKITSLLVNHPRYLPLFTSCNTNWSQLADRAAGPRWCGQCPKCAFVFTMLAAYLPFDQLTDLFGGNLFNYAQLKATFRELFALEGIKPLECVGTPEEMAAAMYLALERSPEVAETEVGKMFETAVMPHYQDRTMLVQGVMQPQLPSYLPGETKEILQGGGLL